MKLYLSDYRENATNVLYGTEMEINGLADLEKATQRDHIAAEMRENHRSSDNFIQADCIMLDLDNTHSDDPADWRSVDDVCDAFPGVPFYYVHSRNSMVPKVKTASDGTVTHFEPREKLHFYFPLSHPYKDLKAYEKLMLEAAGTFPFFDLGAAKPAQFFFGVAKPGGGEETGDVYLDQYLESQDATAITAAVKEFSDKVKSGVYKRGGENEKAINRLYAYLGIQNEDPGQPVAPSGAQDDAEYSDLGYQIAEQEQRRALEWLKTWAAPRGVKLGRAYRIRSREHPDAICICVACPWESEHSMTGADNEAVIIIELGGKFGFLCRHSHGHMYGWKDYRAYYDARYVSDETETTEKQPTKRDSIKEAIRRGYIVYYVISQQDADALAKIGLSAVAIKDTRNWSKAHAMTFKGAKVALLTTEDEAGTAHMKFVQESLKQYAYWSQIVLLGKSTPISGWVEIGGTKEQIKDLVDAGAKYDQRVYGNWLDVQKDYMYEDSNGKLYSTPPKDGTDVIQVVAGISIKVNSDRLAFTYGEGNDFLICRNGTDEKDTFYHYARGVYRAINTNALHGEVKKYMPLGTAKPTEIQNTGKLIMYGSPKHVCQYSDLNRNEEYINLKNGLYLIKDRTLRPHDPSIKSTIQLHCRYNPNAKSPTWDKFIRDFCSDENGVYDESKEKVLQEFIGLTLSNIDFSRVKKLLWLSSDHGDTGKSQILHITSYVLGGPSEEFTANIPLQNLNEDSKFSIGTLQDKRLIAIGDQSKNEVPDVSLVKSLTGGDTVKVEKKFHEPLYMRFTGSIMIASNGMPSLGGNDKGEHLFERFLLIPCRYIVPKDKQDKNLAKKLEAETDGFFTWALEGLHRIIAQDYHFTSCEASREMVDDYRIIQDPLYRFITENGYIITGSAQHRIVRSVFDTAYTEWCYRNELRPINKNGIPSRMMAIGCSYSKKGRINSAYPNNPYYAGIINTSINIEKHKVQTRFLPDKNSEEFLAYKENYEQTFDDIKKGDIEDSYERAKLREIEEAFKKPEPEEDFHECPDDENVF